MDGKMQDTYARRARKKIKELLGRMSKHKLHIAII